MWTAADKYLDLSEKKMEVSIKACSVNKALVLVGPIWTMWGTAQLALKITGMIQTDEQVKSHLTRWKQPASGSVFWEAAHGFGCQNSNTHKDCHFQWEHVGFIIFMKSINKLNLGLSN